MVPPFVIQPPANTTNPTTKPTRLRFVSDLHLFSQRSRAEDHVPAMRRAAEEADLFVLAGDTFDYKWAHQPCPDSFAGAAKDWLADLADGRSDCRFHLLLGNHDHHPALMTRLDFCGRAFQSG